MPKPTKYEFHTQLTAAQKLLIQKAADLEGRSIADFVVHSAEAAAQRIIEERTILTLSARDTEIFVEAIVHPAEPGPSLCAGARQYKRIFGR